MIKMPVRIDRKINGATTQFSNGGIDAIHHLRKLIVHDQHTILADRYGNIATDAEQHVKTVCHLLGHDLSTFKVPSKGSGNALNVHRVWNRWPGVCNPLLSHAQTEHQGEKECHRMMMLSHHCLLTI